MNKCMLVLSDPRVQNEENLNTKIASLQYQVRLIERRILMEPKSEVLVETVEMIQNLIFLLEEEKKKNRFQIDFSYV